MGEQEIQLEQENVIIYSGGGAVNSVNGYTGDVVLTTSDLENTSDYQTGAEVDASIAAAIANKQDVLTAGTNISISNTNVISATDTTYSAGSGLNLDGTTFSVNTNTIATKQSVTDEATARSNADINLQGQIDAITASSDVKDIVGTHAELEAYDTSTLQNNDIIKVLQDETQNDETTYYRWSTTTETFTLIGEEGPYYTKAATDTLLAAKQDTLTAGSNVTIEEESGTGDLVISATDTTYSAFTGTDGQTAGTAGLVPAPATTDAGKFLKADGTWDTAGGGGPTVVQTTGTSQSDVMSQNATTSMVFADPATQYKIKIGAGTSSSEGSDGIEIGHNSAATSTDCIAIGRGAKSYSGYSVAVGSSTAASNGQNLVAIGRNASAEGTGNVCLGAFSKTDTNVQGVVQIGLNSSGSPSHGYNNSKYRLITGVYDPQSAHDAATKGYVDGKVLTNAGAPTTSTVGTVGQLLEDTTNGKLYQCTAVTPGTDPDPDTYTWTEVGAGGSGPTVVQTTGTSQTDVMSQNATTSMIFADPATQYKIKIGAGTSASEGNDGIEIGHNAAATQVNALAIGVSAEATGARSTAVGQACRVRSHDSVGLGGATIGSSSDRSVAIGNTSEVSSNALASIALGAYSKATQQGQMDISTLATTNTNGYNNSQYRLLTGLYDPQSAHDAANKEYVDSAIIQSGTAAPTTSTAAAVGALMATVESGTGHLYICTDDTGGTYTWQALV